MALPSGYQLLHVSQLDSTNQQAMRMAKDGVRQPHWILADEQTAGRGRRGRHWVSPRGNLMTSLYLPTDMTTEQAGQLAFVAGVALAETISHYAAEHRVSLKWPNDVLVNGAKISGILLETLSGNMANNMAGNMANNVGKLNGLAVGMGVNLAAHPDDTPYPATSLKALTGNAPEPLAILYRLAHHFDKLLRLHRDFGFAVILTQWRQWAHNIGQAVMVRLEKQTLEGIFEDIDADGALILRLAADDKMGEKIRITAGDLFFSEMANNA